MHPINPEFNENSPLLAGPTSLKGNPIYIYMVALLSAIGGFLFGYDTGIISGAMIFVREHFDLNEIWQELIVSVTLLSAWLFSIIAGSATDRLGRKPVIIISSVVFVGGSALMAIANDKLILMLGRLVVGAGIGLASMTVPMYIAEMAPGPIRGQLVLLNIVCVTGGQFVASIVAYGLSHIDPELAWRLMLGLAAVPATIQFFAFLAMPESPRWLISKLKYDEAREVLLKIRPEGSDVDAELENIRNNQMKARREFESSRSFRNHERSTFHRIMDSPAVTRALVVGCMLQFVQQLAGINTVMYYTASIFEMSGIYSKPKALLMSSITALVNFLFTLVGFFLVERIGRRKLILGSLVGVVFSLMILGLGFHLAFINSPRITTQVTNSTTNFTCSSYSMCSECARDVNCGYCFSTNSETTISSCLRVDHNDHYQSLGGNCTRGTDEQSHFVWAYEWCPSSYSQYTLIGLILYLVFFAPGLGPMPWTINSEIYPSWARSWCQSAATSVNWLSNLLVSMTFLSLARLITKHGAFYLYGTMAFLGLIFFALVLPETRGKSLEELENLFAPNSTRSSSTSNNKHSKSTRKMSKSQAEDG